MARLFIKRVGYSQPEYDVCVIGGCSIDLTTYEDGLNELFFGGKGANQAVAAARAGAKTCMITKLGKDEYYEPITDNLIKNGVDIYVSTTTKAKNDVTKIYIKDGDNTIERHNEMINTFDSKLVDKFKDVILASKYIVIQNKAPLSFTKYLVDFCHAHKKKVVLTPSNPNQLVVSDENNQKLIDNISYICANEKETKIVFVSEDVVDVVKNYPKKLITTLGARGLIYAENGKVTTLPALKTKNVVDTTGAGDTFCGNFVANLAHGYSFAEAIRVAQYASAYKIRYKSAQAGMPTRAELERFIKENSSKERR